MNLQLQQRATAKEMTKQITKTNTKRRSLQRLTKRVVQAPTLEARAQESAAISIKGSRTHQSTQMERMKRKVLLGRVKEDNLYQEVEIRRDLSQKNSIQGR